VWADESVAVECRPSAMGAEGRKGQTRPIGKNDGPKGNKGVLWPVFLNVFGSVSFPVSERQAVKIAIAA